MIHLDLFFSHFSSGVGVKLGKDVVVNSKCILGPGTEVMDGSTIDEGTRLVQQPVGSGDWSEEDKEDEEGAAKPRTKAEAAGKIELP